MRACVQSSHLSLDVTKQREELADSEFHGLGSNVVTSATKRRCSKLVKNIFAFKKKASV